MNLDLKKRTLLFRTAKQKSKEARIENQNKVIESSTIQQEQIDNKIREIVKLKDELFLLNQKNKDLEEQNNKIINEIEKLNNQLISFIDKIVNTNKNDN